MRTRRHMMRVLFALYRAWREEPSQRLAQLMANKAPAHALHGDLFYVEDEHWLRWVRRL